MQFTLERGRDEHGADRIRFSGEISALDIMRLRLDAFDRRLMDGVKVGEPAAEYLLVLEMLYRRHAEASQAQED